MDSVARRDCTGYRHTAPHTPHDTVCEAFTAIARLGRVQQHQKARTEAATNNFGARAITRSVGAMGVLPPPLPPFPSPPPCTAAAPAFPRGPGCVLCFFLADEVFKFGGGM